MCIGSSKGPSTALRLKAENQAERSTLERWRVWRVWKVWRVWRVWKVWRVWSKGWTGGAIYVGTMEGVVADRICYEASLWCQQTWCELMH